MRRRMLNEFANAKSFSMTAPSFPKHRVQIHLLGLEAGVLHDGVAVGRLKLRAGPDLGAAERGRDVAFFSCNDARFRASAAYCSRCAPLSSDASGPWSQTISSASRA